jgi:hypothetical protein
MPAEPSEHHPAARHRSRRCGRISHEANYPEKVGGAHDYFTKSTARALGYNPEASGFGKPLPRYYAVRGMGMRCAAALPQFGGSVEEDCKKAS